MPYVTPKKQRKRKRDMVLCALAEAADFIEGSNECLDRSSPHSGDKDWIEYCDGLLAFCRAALARSKKED